MPELTDWQINGPLQIIRQRAFLLAQIRSFFAANKVMEVETPVLSSAANTDIQIDVFNTQAIAAHNSHAYLRTSPEFFHKRLLASGSGDIFELAKVFRLGESTALHNPEFTLLEWYRLGFSMHQLMDEVVALVQMLRHSFGLLPMQVSVISYQALYQQYLGIDPFNISDDELNHLAVKADYHGSRLNRTEALDFMFGVQIEPLLDPAVGHLVHEFPIEQAALAKPHPHHADRCLRFEFLWGGVELANGYEELTDANEQRLRFERDNYIRQSFARSELPVDERLLAAMTAGLPACSGVAVGVERLMMCLLEKDSLAAVMPFMASNS